MKESILINIGNTNTVIAFWDGHDFKSIERYDTKSILNQMLNSSIIRNHPDNICLIACVVPSIKEELISDFLPNSIRWLTADMAKDLDFSLVDKSSLGADRLANAVVAVNELDLPAIIIDCGTAITVEVIDNKKRFLGGMILPGRNLVSEALSTGTAQLPRIETFPQQARVIGRNTAESITSGVNIGLLGAVERIIEDIKREINEPNLIPTIVGGDRNYFAKNLLCSKLGPENFTLKGLAMIAEDLED